MKAQLTIIVSSAIAICTVVGISTPFVLASASSLANTMHDTTKRLESVTGEIGKLPVVERDIQMLRDDTKKSLDAAFERLRTVETLQAEIGADMRALKEAVLDIRTLLQQQNEWNKKHPD